MKFKLMIFAMSPLILWLCVPLSSYVIYRWLFFYRQVMQFLFPLS